MTSKFKQIETEVPWEPLVEEEDMEVLFPPTRLRLLLNRAVSLYVGLFFGLSMLLSLLGVDPLIHNGLMPKALLIYVGIALLLAWASSEVQRLDEPSPGWLVRVGKWRL
jgi:hypothetical protein